jgi:hypothetical protein
MAELGAPLLINVLGHAGGTLIFAIFLVLLFSGRGWSGAQGRYLPALAAILALVWNLGSLLVLYWPVSMALQATKVYENRLSPLMLCIRARLQPCRKKPLIIRALAPAAVRGFSTLPCLPSPAGL